MSRGKVNLVQTPSRCLLVSVCSFSWYSSSIQEGWLILGGRFSPAEVQQSATERPIQWVRSDGTPSGPALGLEEVIDVIVVLSSIQRVLSGKHLNVSEVNFRNPNMFVAGEIHNHQATFDIKTVKYPRTGISCKEICS